MNLIDNSKKEKTKKLKKKLRQKNMLKIRSSKFKDMMLENIKKI